MPSRKRTKGKARKANAVKTASSNGDASKNELGVPCLPAYHLELTDTGEFHPCYVLKSMYAHKSGDVLPSAVHLFHHGVIPASADNIDIVQVNTVDTTSCLVCSLGGMFPVSPFKVSIRRDVLEKMCDGNQFENLKRFPFVADQVRTVMCHEPIDQSMPAYHLELADTGGFHPCYVLKPLYEHKSGDVILTARRLVMHGTIPASADNIDIVQVNTVDNANRLVSSLGEMYPVSPVKVSIRRDVLERMCNGNAFEDLKTFPFVSASVWMVMCDALIVQNEMILLAYPPGQHQTATNTSKFEIAPMPFFHMKLVDTEDFRPCYLFETLHDLQKGEEVPNARHLVKHGVIPASADNIDIVLVNRVETLNQEGRFPVNPVKVPIRRDVMEKMCDGNAFDDLKRFPFISASVWFFVNLVEMDQNETKEVFRAGYMVQSKTSK